MILGNVQRFLSSFPRRLPRRGLGWAHLAAALAAGLVLRLVFVHFYGQTTGDTLVYGDIAKNLLQQGVYGMSGGDSVTPTLIRLPGYPLFLAACFRVFGVEHYTAVMLVQSVVDVGTCALCAATAARLFGRRAGVCALWLGLLCPFTINYVATPLTETLSLFCIALAFYALARWQAEGVHRADASFWMMAVAMAYAILLRPDGGLLAAVVVPGMAWIAWRDPVKSTVKAHKDAVRLTVLLCVVVLLPLVPWTARNWRDFHVVQPLAPRYATDPTELVAHGFNHWYRSWAIDFASTEDIYWNLNGETIQIDDIPTRAFDSDAQYDETAQLLADYNNTTTLTPELDGRFQKIADERIAANPMRYYVTLPAARLADMWLRPRTEILPVEDTWWKGSARARVFPLGYAALNLLYIVMAGFGAWLACKRLPREKRPIGVPVIWAMLAYVVLRSMLLFTLDNSEDRYTLEFFPLFFVLAGYAVSCCAKSETETRG
jgi:4-amino-4-deoxy-L-arabinose transferase-like glycosyltransferase